MATLLIILVGVVFIAAICACYALICYHDVAHGLHSLDDFDGWSD